MNPKVVREVVVPKVTAGILEIEGVINLFRNLITLPTDVSKSCNLSEC